MKSNVIYGSIFNDRQWCKVDGVLQTRTPGEIWRAVGWPQPDMSEKDVDYYIHKGEFLEVTE